MSTGFPETEEARLTMTVKAPKTLTIALRRPLWAGTGFVVKVNDREVSSLPAPGSYVEVTRTWNTGDAIALVLPKALHLEPTPDNPRRAAIMWGPLVLAGDLGPEPPRTRESEMPPPVDVPVLVTANRPVDEWLKPVPGESGAFRTAGVGRDRDVTLAPFYRVQHRVYSAYWDLFTPAEWDTRSAEIAADRERVHRLEASTVAFVQPGDMQPDRDFNQQGENTTVARVNGRQGRSGRSWFSYDVPVEESRPMVLVVTYHTDSRRPRSFEILADGQRIAQQAFDRSSISRFIDLEYPIPTEILRGKNRTTIRFVATNGNDIAAVFGLRMVRADAR